MPLSRHFTAAIGVALLLVGCRGSPPTEPVSPSVAAGENGETDEQAQFIYAPAPVPERPTVPVRVRVSMSSVEPDEFRSSLTVHDSSGAALGGAYARASPTRPDFSRPPAGTIVTALYSPAGEQVFRPSVPMLTSMRSSSTTAIVGSPTMRLQRSVMWLPTERTARSNTLALLRKSNRVRTLSVEPDEFRSSLTVHDADRRLAGCRLHDRIALIGLVTDQALTFRSDFTAPSRSRRSVATPTVASVAGRLRAGACTPRELWRVFGVRTRDRPCRALREAIGPGPARGRRHDITS